LAIDPQSHVPIFLQIVEHLSGAIAAGVYRPGEALPSQRALAVSLTVNPNTVQKAFEELERRGLALSRRGVGLFVTDRGAQSAQHRAEEAIADSFRRAIVAALGANFPETRIREIFEAALRQSAGEPSARNKEPQ
jgi:DNA-binding transcriptional regulator YhcF (GntR family)